MEGIIFLKTVTKKLRKIRKQVGKIMQNSLFHENEENLNWMKVGGK